MKPSPFFLIKIKDKNGGGGGYCQFFVLILGYGRGTPNVYYRALQDKSPRDTCVRTSQVISLYDARRDRDARTYRHGGLV